MSNERASYDISDVKSVGHNEITKQNLNNKVRNLKRVLTFISIESAGKSIVLVDIFELSSSELLRGYLGHN